MPIMRYLAVGIYTLAVAAAPPSPLLAVPNVTTHPSTASVPVYCCMMVRCPMTTKGLTMLLHSVGVLPSPDFLCRGVISGSMSSGGYLRESLQQYGKAVSHHETYRIDQ